MESNLLSHREGALSPADFICINEVAIPRSSDRLFYLLDVGSSRAPIEITVAGSGVGKTRLVGKLLSHQIYKDLSAYLDRGRQTEAQICRGNLYVLQSSATVGHLLNRNRSLWSTVHDDFSGAVTFSNAFDIEQLKGRINAHLLALPEYDWIYPERNSLRLTSLKKFEYSHLVELLRTLDVTEDVSMIESWVNALSERKVSLPPGVLPDSPAIALIKRMLQIDFDKGAEVIRRFIRPDRNESFRYGYFQLSLAGAILAKLSDAKASPEFREWIWKEINFLRSEGIHGFEDRSLAFALLAALTAIVILAEENSVHMLGFLDGQLEALLNVASGSSEKKRFLRILGDSLNQGIKVDNLYANFAKVMVFIKHAKDDLSLIRPQNRLMTIFREILEPAKGLLNAT